jgi:hypothetical protein
MIHSLFGERRLYGTNTADQTRIFFSSYFNRRYALYISVLHGKLSSIYDNYYILVSKRNEPVYLKKAGLVLNFAISKRNELVYSKTWQYQSK